MRNLTLLALLCSSLWATPAAAYIVHHCDYGTDTEEVHNNEPGAGGCTNQNDQGGGEEGSCDHTNGFWWGTMNCYGAECSFSGQINCNGTLRTFNFFCLGDKNGQSYNPPSSMTRTSVTCDGGDFGNFQCDCNASQGYWDTNCNNP